MTDFHAMPDSELNEWIAARQGWKYVPECLYTGQQAHWERWSSGYLFLQDTPPDYCHNWNYAGWLLEEMKSAYIDLGYGKCVGGDEAWACRNINNVYSVSKSPTRAIAEAYAVMAESNIQNDGCITKKDGEG